MGFICEDYLSHASLIVAWREHFHALRLKQGETVNLSLREFFPERAYDPVSKVIEFRLDSPDIFYRVHRFRNQHGRWLLRYEDIHALSADQIRRKYALKDEPLFLSKFKVKAGLHLRMGLVAENGFGGDRAAVQYEILDESKLKSHLMLLDTIRLTAH